MVRFSGGPWANRFGRFLLSHDEDSETFETIELFAGAERDEESSLHFHDRRYFDPLTATWISAEPIAFARADDPNLTPYVGGGRGSEVRRVIGSADP